MSSGIFVLARQGRDRTPVFRRAQQNLARTNPDSIAMHARCADNDELSATSETGDYGLEVWRHLFRGKPPSKGIRCLSQDWSSREHRRVRSRELQPLDEVSVHDTHCTLEVREMGFVFWTWRSVMLKQILLSTLLIANSVSAGTRDPSTPDEKYLEFGKKFRCVQKIRANSGDEVQFGSVVIIKPNWALTAAHVVDGTTDQVIVMDDGSEFPVASVFVHPDFEDVEVGYHDIAICYSPSDFGLEFYTPLHRGSDEVGKSVTIAGYGIAGTFLTGGVNPDGQKRAGHNKISSQERSVLICCPDREGRLPLEFCITAGDSGGGLFIGNELAGINSFLMAEKRKPNGLYGDEAAHTRISLYFDWICSQIESHEMAIAARATMSSTHRTK
jgi:hypothetical protein